MVSGPLSGNVNTTRGVIRIDAQFRQAINAAARAQAAFVGMAKGLKDAVEDSEKSITAFNAAVGRMGAEAKAAAQLQKQRVREMSANEREIQRGVANTAKARNAAFKENVTRMQSELRASVSLERQKQQAIRATETERRRQFRESQQAGRQLQQVLIGLSISAGVVTRSALESADRLARFEASFRAILGSEQKVANLMEAIAESTEKFGLNLAETRQLARGLLPILGDNVDRIQEFVEQAARLGTLPSVGGGKAALRAIQELAAGQTRSIIQLFNIPPDVVNQAKAQFSDLGDQLDFILNAVGATEEAALSMANSWEASSNRMRNAVSEFLARGIQPLITKGIAPLARGIARFFDLMRTEAPVLSTALVTLVALTAVLGPLALAITTVAIAYNAMALNAAAAGAASKAVALGRIGAGALITAGVIEGAAFGARQAGIGPFAGQSQSEAVETLINGFKQQLAILIAFLGNLVQRMGELFASIQIVFGIGLDIIENAFGALSDVLNNATVDLQRGFGDILVALAGFIEGISITLPTVLGVGGDTIGIPGAGEIAGGLRSAGAGLQGAERRDVRGIGQTPEQMQATADRALELSDSFNRFAESMANFAITLFESGQVVDDANKGLQEAARTRADILRDIAEAELQIRLEEAAAVIALTKRFERARTRFVEDQARARFQAERRFLDRRRRLNADLERDLAQLRLDFFMNQRELVNEFNEKRIEAEREAHEAIGKIIAESKIKVLEAAARLDAQAVFEEQRRRRQKIAETRTEAEQEGQERFAELQKRLAQLREQFELETTARRAQFAVDLSEMTIQFQLQQTVRAENAAVRLARMKEDNARELFELQVQFAAKRQKATILLLEELKDFDARALAAKRQAGVLADINTSGALAAQSAFNGFWSSIQATMAAASGGAAVASSSGRRTTLNPLTGRRGLAPVPLFQTGGNVGRSGLIHADAGEFVLAKDTARFVKRMLGGAITQPAITNALAGSGGGGSTSVELHTNGPLIVGDVGGLKEDEVRELLKDVLMELFQSRTIR